MYWKWKESSQITTSDFNKWHNYLSSIAFEIKEQHIEINIISYYCNTVQRHSKSLLLLFVTKSIRYNINNIMMYF